MTTSITLITTPNQADLPEWAGECAYAMGLAGFAVERVTLSAHEAEDIVVASEDVAAVRAIADDMMGVYPVDVIVQSATTRRKKFLLADLESTIIEQEMLEEMADAIYKRAEVTAITQRAMNGELDFAASLRERVALFAGLPATLIDDMARRMTLMPGAVTLLATLRHHGVPCWLATGGFHCYAQLIAARLGFAQVYANDLLIADGKITGQVAEPILDKNAKLTTLQRGVADYGLTLAETITVGDGANDLAMLTASSESGGLGIAFHAKRTVQDQAMHKINHGDLTGLLFAQGYKRDDFVA